VLLGAQSANMSSDGAYAGNTAAEYLRVLQGGMAGAQNQNPAAVQLDGRKVKLISEAEDSTVILMYRRHFLQELLEGKMDSAVLAAYLQKLDARTVELSKMPSSVPPPSGVDAATAATLNRGQARGAGSGGGAREAAGVARGGGASSATRIGDPTGIPAGFGWRQSLSQDQLRLRQMFAPNQQTGATTEDTGTAAGLTLDAEEASQSPAPPAGPRASAGVGVEIDSDVVDAVRDDARVDRQRWKSKDVQDVLRATSSDPDAAVKAIIVLTSLALVDKAVAVDFATSESARALSVSETDDLVQAVVREFRLLDKEDRKAVKRKHSNNVSPEALGKLVYDLWPPKENETVTRQEKGRRKEAANEALKCQGAAGRFPRLAFAFYAIPEDVEVPDFEATLLADVAIGKALAQNTSATADHHLLVLLASLCAAQRCAAKAAAAATETEGDDA